MTLVPACSPRFALGVLFVSAALTACGGNPPPPDPCTRITCPPTTVCQAGACVPDGTAGGGGSTPRDAGTGDGGMDADGGLDADAGMDADGGTDTDAGMDQDAGTFDAGMQMDAGTGGTDAGTSMASMQIAQARMTPDGTGLSLPISGAVVTYLKPAVGSEPAGFTIQGEPSGPAIYVNLDPQTLSPSPVVGDTVAFTITGLGTLGGATVRMVSEIAPGSWMRLSSGTPVSGFVQNLSSAPDLVSNLNGYEAEVVQVAATLTGSFGGAGTGHSKIPVTTSGYPSGDPQLRLRVPTALRDAADLAAGCNVTLQGTPMWRVNAEAQLAAWTQQDLTVTGCPSPALVSAAALAPNQVRLTFDRNIAPSSVSATGISFNGGLFALSATATGRNVTVTTSPQTAGTAYTVTVAASVTDTYGTPVNPNANTATFTGFTQPATFVVNEINPQMASGRDLIELRALQGGSMNGIRVEQIGTSAVIVLATLPDVVVAAGDLVVVHLNSGTLPTETLSQSQEPKAVTPENYDGAWDVHSGSSGMNGLADRIIRVATISNTIQDAVPFIAPAAAESATFMAEFNAMVSSGAWVLTTPCAAAACTLAEAKANAVDWTGVSSNDTTSTFRLSGANSRSQSDWAKATTATGIPATFGAPNP